MSTSQLEQFCELFPTESDLQQVLVELLSKLPGVTGVRRLQGTTERGKDLVFYHESPFGMKRLIACVVKNTPITGAVGSSKGARTVLLQAQQAFDSPYTTSDGSEERVEHVYVIVPHACSPDAMDSVKGALGDRSGQVTFLCGNDLLDIFKERWPAFLAFQGDFLGRYLNDLRLHVDADPNLAAMILRHSIIAPANRLLSAVYVPQQLKADLLEFRPRTLSWYGQLFSNKVSFSEVQDAVFNLGILSSVLAYSRVWAHKGTAWRIWSHASRLLQRTSQELPTLWKAAYRRLVALSHDRPPESSACVDLCPDPSLRDDYPAALAAAKECWNEFCSVLRNQGSRARSFPPSASHILQAPDYPRYCALADAVDRIPLAVEKSKVIMSVTIRQADFRGSISSLLITAPAGFGKTSLCKYHALRDADELLKGSGDVLPIYVPLHQLAETEGNTFADMFLRAEDLRQVMESGDKESLPFQRVRMYLDGLDEVVSPERRRLVVRAALSASLAWPVQVVVTARDHVYDDYLTELPRVALSSLDSAGIEQLVRQWLDTDADGIAEIQNELVRNASLRDLMAVPLLGTLVIGVYRKLRRLPETKVALYEMFADLLCGGWDVVKNISRGGRFSPVVKMTVLKKLAGQLHGRRLRYATLNDIQRAIGFSLNRLEPECPAFVEELLQDGLLARSGQTYLFCHLSFQEFLAAKDLADPMGRAQTSALRRFLLGDNWWREVVGFYIGLVNDPGSVHEWIGSVARGIVRSGRNVVESEVKGRCRALETVVRATYPEFSAPPIFN